MIIAVADDNDGGERLTIDIESVVHAYQLCNLGNSEPTSSAQV